MGMNLGNHHTPSNEPEVMMDVNTTPLIDVMLVLLIMLIITIPAQLHSVNLDLPVAAPPTKKVEPVVIKIDIDANNVIAWNGKALASREDLQTNLREAKRVVDAVVEHIANRPNESLGIVTLNIKQRDLIAELLEERLRSVRGADTYREDWITEGAPK